MEGLLAWRNRALSRGFSNTQRYHSALARMQMTTTTVKSYYLMCTQCQPLMMFMSDGKPHDPEEGEDAIRALYKEISSRTSELQVKTLAFGNGADTEKLQALATAGGGEFLLAVDGVELKACFENTAASLVKTHFR